ncbi:OB-fold nucleic acid binding domain-containing protein [Nitrospira sp. Kam-Ns4a]
MQVFGLLLRSVRVVCRPTLLSWLLLLVTAASGDLVAGGRLELAELLSHPEQYDKQVVTVVGRVSNLQIASNRQGQLAYGFLLKDGNGSVKVVALGKAEVHEGDQVIVEGVFSRQRLAGRSFIYNEIKASSVRSLERFSPDFVG